MREKDIAEIIEDIQEGVICQKDAVEMLQKKIEEREIYIKILQSKIKYTDELNLSQCNHCLCMTKNVCGKCKQIKGE